MKQSRIVKLERRTLLVITSLLFILISGCSAKLSLEETTISTSAVTLDNNTHFETVVADETGSTSITSSEKTAIVVEDNIEIKEQLPFLGEKSLKESLKIIKGSVIEFSSECFNEQEFERSDYLAEAKRQYFENFISGNDKYGGDIYEDLYSCMDNPPDTPDRITFSQSVSYDFDKDGEIEYLMYLDIPDGLLGYWYPALYYADNGSVICIGESDEGHKCIHELIDYGDFYLVSVHGGVLAASSMYDALLKFKVPEMVENVFCEKGTDLAIWDAPASIDYQNGIFKMYSPGYHMGTDYCNYSYAAYTSEGKFVNIGCEEISVDEFMYLLESDGELAEKYNRANISTERILKISTAGYISYYIEYKDEDGNMQQWHSDEGVIPDAYYFNNIVYGTDSSLYEYIEVE